MDYKIDIFQDKLYDLINNSELPAGVVVLILKQTTNQVEDVHRKMSATQAPAPDDPIKEEQHTMEVEVPLDDIPMEGEDGNSNEEATDDDGDVNSQD